MFQKFNELFNALNEEALKRSDEDITLLENAQCAIVDAWTDYMMSQEEPPSEEVVKQHAHALELVSRF